MGKSSLYILLTVFLALPAHAFRVTAVGDIMLGTDFPEGKSVVERDFFREVRPFLSGSDIRIGNFEGTLYDGPHTTDSKRAGPNRYLFRTPTRLAPQLIKGGFNFMSLANNHARDFGRAGLESTKRTLESLGIGYSSKDGEASDIESSGVRAVVVSGDFYSGRRSITTPQSFYAEINELGRQYDIVVVMIHAGAEGVGAQNISKGRERYLGEDRGDSITFAHQAIENGADLVLMAGPHVPRGIEVYKDRLIAYSLGNFITESGISISGYQGLAPLIEVDMESDGRFKSGRIHSFKQVRGQVVSLDPSKRAARLIGELSRQDFPATAPAIDASGTISPRDDFNLR